MTEQYNSQFSKGCKQYLLMTYLWLDVDTEVHPNKDVVAILSLQIVAKK